MLPARLSFLLLIRSRPTCFCRSEIGQVDGTFASGNSLFNARQDETAAMLPSHAEDGSDASKNVTTGCWQVADHILVSLIRSYHAVLDPLC